MKSKMSLPSKDRKVSTAVEFLRDVHQKGHKLEELRKYLINRRQLSETQVDEAFKLLHTKIDRRKSDEKLASPKENGDRPEVSTGEELANRSNFFIKEKRVVGAKLIKDFLKTENSYVGVLECLQNDYFRELCSIGNKKTLLTQADLNTIFRRIPCLLEFHKEFLDYLKNQPNNIGQGFVREFKHFKVYVEYMKDCTAMILKMRKHIHDEKLHSCLELLRKKSRRKSEDMVDLLLVPLDRIMDYKEILDKLHQWTDKGWTKEFVFLGKAARRIGRIANYIGTHKAGIANRNEMNKVQLYLGRQCDILNPLRQIIRRGLMIRRTTSWPARKKHYVFFLFNDLLLWTTRKGELKNVVRLSGCQVLPSASKTAPERKFTIVSRGENKVQKVLLLECTVKRQRDEWFTLINKEIQNSWAPDGSSTKAVASSEEDFIKVLDLNTAPVVYGPPTTRDSIIEEEAKEDEEVVSTSEVEEENSSVRGHRYQDSKNFDNAEFIEEFAPLDDTASVTSEDQEHFSLMRTSQDEYGDTMGKIFPNMVSSRSTILESKETPKERYHRSSVVERIRTPTDTSHSTVDENIITKESKKEEIRISWLPKDAEISAKSLSIDLEQSSTYTVWLNDF